MFCNYSTYFLPQTIFTLAPVTSVCLDEDRLTSQQVGEEQTWLQQHKEDFRRLADEGEEDFVELIEKLEKEA